MGTQHYKLYSHTLKGAEDEDFLTVYDGVLCLGVVS